MPQPRPRFHSTGHMQRVAGAGSRLTSKVHSKASSHSHSSKSGGSIGLYGGDAEDPPKKLPASRLSPHQRCLRAPSRWFLSQTNSGTFDAVELDRLWVVSDWRLATLLLRPHISKAQHQHRHNTTRSRRKGDSKISNSSFFEAKHRVRSIASHITDPSEQSISCLISYHIGRNTKWAQ